MKYILEYSRYNKPSRADSLTEDVFKYLLKLNCSDWLKNPKPLIRFKQENSDGYEIIKPSLHTRVSLNDDNYNTMLMDNLPSWSKFPKRSESIIFFNGAFYTDDFGDYFNLIIPFDRAKFGVSPALDLFDSFNNRAGYRLSFNSNFSRSLFNIDAPTNYTDFSKYMNEELIKPDFFDNKHDAANVLELRKGFMESKNKNFMEYLNDILAPENFDSEYIYDGFKIMNYENMSSVRNGKTPVESWTDSDCLVVPMGLAMSTNDIEKKFKNFMEYLNV